MDWKKTKSEDDKINNLMYDTKYVEKIYDEEDNTYLDFFYAKKVNHSFNDYLKQVGRNEANFSQYC